MSYKPEEVIPKKKYPSDYERRRNQTALLDTINKDLVSQTEKIQYLSKDINQISQKVRHTREISKEYKAILKENLILKNEIKELKIIFEKFECKNKQLENLTKKMQLRIDELEYHLRKKTELANEKESNFQDLIKKFEEMEKEVFEEKGIYIKDNNELKNEIINLTQILEQKEKNILILSRDFESLELLNQKTTEELELSLKKAENNENTSKNFYFDLVKFKELYKEEKTKNNLLTRETQESLLLFKSMNEDYERVIHKLVDLESRCEEQVKINNRLRDRLNYEEVINYKGKGVEY